MKFLTFPYRAIRWMMLARPIRFTRFGTFYILFTLGVGAAAINTGNNLLYLILGILLGFIIISGFLSDSALWGIATEWTPIGSLYAGEKNRFECRLSKGTFPGVAITVTSRWEGHQPLTAFVPWIPSKETVSTSLDCLPQKRGRLTLENCRYSTCFPFGLFEKSHRELFDREWIVYPRLYPIPDAFLAESGQDAALRSSHKQGLGALPFLLRDYRSGDALRQVHWKMTAKRQRLIVKEMEEESGQGDLLYLESWPAGFDSDEMERFISFIASLAFAAYQQARPIGLAAPERLFKPDYSRLHLHQILEYLALVDPARDPLVQTRKIPLEWNVRRVDLLPLWTAGGRDYVRAA